MAPPDRHRTGHFPCSGSGCTFRTVVTGRTTGGTCPDTIRRPRSLPGSADLAIGPERGHGPWFKRQRLCPSAGTGLERLMDTPMQTLILSGKSGAGKTTALQALEGLGLFAVEYLPPSLWFLIAHTDRYVGLIIMV